MERMVLRGALVVDGTGNDARRADVLVDRGRIAQVDARVDAPRDTTTVDLDGLVLAPGFIDPHTHYDAQVFWDPNLTPSSWHGVTTTMIGNCGFGLAPTRPDHRPTIMRVLENVEGMPYDALESGIDWSFESFRDYLNRLARVPLRINMTALIGHTPVRYYVMGDDATERRATAAEVAQMRALVDDALDAGAIGFSSSRSQSHVGAYGRPIPSRAADLDELHAILDVLRQRNAGVFECTWGPDLHVDEFAEIAHRIGRPVSWAAITADKRTSGEAVRVAERAAELGGPVFPQIACRPIVVQIALADPFPFAAAPAFAEILTLDRSARAVRYADVDWRTRAHADMLNTWGPILDGAVVAESDAHPELIEGPTLGELARERRTTPIDAMADLALAENLATKFRVAMVNDDDEQLATLLQQPHLLVGLSDAGAHTSQLCDANYATHLLGYWWRARGVLSLERAVWRLTGHPAAVLGLTDRGHVAPGYAADLVAFEPDRVGTGPAVRVRDFPGGCDRLVAPSEGIEHIWVNGTATRRDGLDLQGVAPGLLLRA